jgi:hypothetical protein
MTSETVGRLVRCVPRNREQGVHRNNRLHIYRLPAHTTCSTKLHMIHSNEGVVGGTKKEEDTLNRCVPRPFPPDPPPIQPPHTHSTYPFLTNLTEAFSVT